MTSMDHVQTTPAMPVTPAPATPPPAAPAPATPAPPPAPGQGFGAPTRVQGGAAAPSEVRLARARLSSRLGKVALAIGWIPLIGWLVAAPLMLVGTVLGWMSNYNAPHPAARTALLINGAAGIVTFLSIWGVMAWAGTA